MSENSGKEKSKQQIDKLEKEISALKKKQAELRYSKERFQTIFDSIDEIYFELDLKGNFTYFNPALSKISGYSSDELMGKNNREYASPEFAKRMYKIYNKIYRTGEPARIADYEIFYKNGNPAILEVSAYLIKDNEGNPIGFRGIGRDVTKRKAIENKLRESEERFRKLNEASFSGVFIHEKGRIIDCNTEMSRITGYACDELIGMDGFELCAPEYRKKVKQKIQSNDEKPYDIIALKKGGTKFPVEIHGKSIPFQGKKIRVTEFRDTTQRKKAEDALKRSRVRYRQLYNEAHEAEELYQSLLDSSVDAIILLDIKLKVKFINPAFTQIFGWTLKEMENDKISYIPKPLKASFSKLISKVIDLDHPIRGYETQRYTKDGRLLDVSLSASRCLDHSGEPSGTLVIVRDITEAKRYQWHMQQAQKMESLGTLAGGVAHDFNNLLMGIQGRLSLLKLNKKQSDSDLKHLKEIEEYVDRAAGLSRQLLGIAKSGKYEVKPTNINKLVNQQNNMFGRTRREIVIHEDFDENLLTAEVDQRQIEQVLLNMYVNASYAMPEGGDLYIRTQNESLGKDRTSPYDLVPGRYIKISVTDTGIGMDEATRRRIFEPFFSTRQRDRGTGLGLASAYGIIKNHDGFITVYSEKGKGTTFNIFLPVSSKAAENETAINEEIVEGEGTILLVDDEEMIINVAEEMIRALGYDVITANNGQEALDMYQKQKGRIDMVILDLIMPGMGGGETFNQLRSIDSEIKVLLSSGYSINGQASSIMKRGCSGFIQKPFGIQELSQKISEIIASKDSK